MSVERRREHTPDVTDVAEARLDSPADLTLSHPDTPPIRMRLTPEDVFSRRDANDYLRTAGDGNRRTPPKRRAA